MDMPDLLKPSGVIHVNHFLSGGAMRTYNCLLAYIQDEIADLDAVPTFQVPKRVVLDYLRTRNEEKLKEWLRELRRSDVEFNMLGKGKTPSWGCYGFIESPELCGGYIRFTIAPRLRQHMADSTMFAKINLMLERKFKKSKYALPLYELGLDYRDAKDPLTGKGCTPWMTLSIFRKYMGVGKKEYVQFYVLNRDVIQKALREIKAESDLVMAMEKRLEKRRVVAIRFTIEDNRANMSATERLQRLQQQLPGLEGEAGIEQGRYAQIMTEIFDISPGRAKKLARLYVGHGQQFETVCKRIEKYKLEGRVKSKLGAYAAKVFHKENPVCELPEG